jgi:hypothetical protein
MIGRNVKCVQSNGLLAGDDVATVQPTCAALARAATQHWPEPVVEASIIDYATNVPVTRRSSAAAEFSGAEPHSIAIYTISRPLHGGMDAPATDEHMNQEQVERIIAMMRLYSDCESIISAVDAFIASVKGAGDLGELEPPINTLVLRQCEVAADMILRSSMYRYVPLDPSGGDRMHLVLLLECYILHRLHGMLMAWLSMLYLQQNRVLKETLAALVDLQQADAGIKPKLRCSYTPVLEALNHLPDAKTPLAKLQALKSASLAIETCVTRHLHAIGSDVSSVELGADDRLNILLYVLVQGAYRYGTGDLILHLQFVDIYGSTMSSRSSNELSQKCVEFRVVTEYLLTKGREELRRDIDARRATLGRPGAPSSLAERPFRKDSQDGGGGAARAIAAAALEPQNKAGGEPPTHLTPPQEGFEGGGGNLPSISDLGQAVTEAAFVSGAGSAAAQGSSSGGGTGSAQGGAGGAYGTTGTAPVRSPARVKTTEGSLSGTVSPAHTSPDGASSRRQSLQRGTVVQLGDSDSDGEGV